MVNLKFMNKIRERKFKNIILTNRILLKVKFRLLNYKSVIFNHGSAVTSTSELPPVLQNPTYIHVNWCTCTVCTFNKSQCARICRLKCNLQYVHVNLTTTLVSYYFLTIKCTFVITKPETYMYMYISICKYMVCDDDQWLTCI